MNKALYRLLLNWYQASDKPIPAWLDKACERHPELAQERDAGDELTRALKKRPNEARLPTGDSMASRVLRQITEEDYLAEERTRESTNKRGAWVRASALAAAAFAVLLAVLQFTNSPEQGSVSEDEAIAQVATGTLEQVREGAIGLDENWKNPLDQEIEYIVSDAKGAFDFIAAKFVPSSLLKKSEEDSKA